METFDAEWLALREPIDHRSRAEPLLAPLVAAWHTRGWSRVLDLGSGSGSNLRYLARRLPSAQQWVLVDHDLEHLRTAGRGDLPATVQDLSLVRGDLAEEGLSAIGRVDLVTASALLDLVSEHWVSRLVAACVESGRGAHFALSYDGTVRWSVGEECAGTGDPDDALVLEAVNVHQTLDKGLGPALGPAAGQVTERWFRTAGYQTWLLPSPWRLGAADASVVHRLINGWETAAAGVRPGAADRIHAWADRRREIVAGVPFTLTVGHGDLLALPPERS
jgi:SAM-dependent methyltransferase